MLRDYQVKAIEGIRAHFKRGSKKVLLHLATGAGKTHCFSYMLKQCHEKNTKAIMVVRGRDLVDQASERLEHEDVPHGVLMAGHQKFDLSKNIQICSIDTINARSIYPEASFIVIDEVHMAGSESFKKFIEHYPDAFILGVTATPYGDADLTHVVKDVVAPIPIQNLIDQGYLVDAKYYSAPEYIDLSDVKITKGDYNEKQLSEKMSDIKLIADIVGAYKKHGDNRKSLCFAVNIEHSKKIAQSFNDSGIPAIHLDAKASREERLAAIEGLKDGVYKVITNVGIFTTGVDIPFLECIIMARPTKSYNLFIQMLGRGTRIYPGKEYFLVLDHGQTVSEHGFITMNRDISINKERRNKNGAAPVKQCPECFAINFAAASKCVLCDHVFTVTNKNNETLNIDLKEIKDPLELMIARIINKQKKNNYAPGWVWHQLTKRFDKSTSSKIFWKNIVPNYFPNYKKSSKLIG